MITPDVPRRSSDKQLRPASGESGRGDGERADKSSCALAWRATSGPIPKFVNARGILRYELRNLRTTSNSMNLVQLLNLRFLNELAATNDRNLKFAALVLAEKPLFD